jgi:uncharacterized protein YrrD
MPVISLSDGRVVGRVKDVIFDAPACRISGFLLRETRWLTDALVLPMDRVRSLGRDALMVPDRTAVQPSVRVRPLRRLLNSGVRMVGLHMLTEGGADLGTVSEVFVGPSGEIVGYELEPGLVEETLHGRRLVPASSLLAAGPDAAIVPDDVEELIRRPEQIVEPVDQAAGQDEDSDHRMPEGVTPVPAAGQ